MFGGFVRGVLVALVACVAVIAAMGNGWYWWRVNAGSIEAQLIGVAFSLVAGALKIGVPVYVAAQGLKWRQRPKLIAVALMGLTFDAWSGIGYVGLIRDDAATTRRVASRAADDARARLPDLRSALAAIGPAGKPSAYYPGQIAVQETVAGTCPAPRPGARLSDPCTLLGAIKAEYATAQAREKVASELAAAEALAASAPAADARPEVAPVVKALASFGLVVSADFLAAVWSVFMLVFVELAPVAVIAEMMRRTPATTPTTGTKLTPTPTPSAGSRPRPAPATGGSIDILSAVAALPVDADGWRAAPQRALSIATKASATTVGRALKAAVAAGQLELVRTSKGARVRIVTS